MAAAALVAAVRRIALRQGRGGTPKLRGKYMRSDEELMAEARRERLDNAILAQAAWLRRIFWLLLIAFFVVPFLEGLVLGVFRG